MAVIERSRTSWLVAGIIPGVERQPLKKLAARWSDTVAQANEDPTNCDLDQPPVGKPASMSSRPGFASRRVIHRRLRV
jgi:hypothetical protein